MSQLLPLKFQLFPAILVVLATQSSAYEPPSDPRVDDTRFLLSSLQLDLSDRIIESSIDRQGENAATIKYMVGEKEGFSIFSNYSSRMRDPFDLSGELEADEFWDLSLRTPRSGALPAVEVDFSTGGSVGGTGDEFSNETRHMFNFGSEGKVGNFDYGVSYQVVGANYDFVEQNDKIKDEDKDRKTIHSWAGMSFGNLFVSKFITHTESNIGRTSEPAVRESLVGTSANYTLHDWPYIGTSFSHATGTRESSENNADDAFEVAITSMAGSVNVSHNIWSADFSIERTTPDTPSGQSFGQPDSTAYYLGGSIYPNETLSFTPSISVSEDSYGDYGVETKTVSTALSLSYSPARTNYSFMAYASNDTLKNLEWEMDTTHFYSEAGIEWALVNRGSTTSLLSLTIGYDRYEDEVYSDSNSSDLSVKLSFRSYSLGSIFGSNSRYRGNNSSLFPDVNTSANSTYYTAFP